MSEELPGPSNIQKTPENEFEKTAANIREEFLSMYPRFGDELRIAPFSKFKEILEGDGFNINMDVSIDEFKKRITQALLKAFNTMWDMQNITQSLSALEYLKNRYKNSQSDKWRPYGKTPIEQTRPYRVRMLQKECSYFEKQLLFQKEKLESVFQVIEENRKRLSAIQKKRESTLFQLETQTEHYYKIKEQIKKLQLEVLDDLTKQT